LQTNVLNFQHKHFFVSPTIILLDWFNIQYLIGLNDPIKLNMKLLFTILCCLLFSFTLATNSRSTYGQSGNCEEEEIPFRHQPPIGKTLSVESLSCKSCYDESCPHLRFKVHRTEEQLHKFKYISLFTQQLGQLVLKKKLVTVLTLH
jgi:hypothetical protein